MKKDTDEKSLIVYKEKNIFIRIIKFFKKVLYNKDNEVIATGIPNVQNTINTNNTKNNFYQKLKVIDEELEKLKQDIENKKIAITDLTEEQIDKLQEAYDRQIENDRIRLSELQVKLKYLTDNS